MSRILFSALFLVPVALHAQTPAPEPSMPRDPVIATVLGKDIRLSQKHRMSGIIFGTLLARYAQDHDLAATPDELATFVAHTEKRDAQDRKKWAAAQEKLQARLKEKIPDEGVRRDLETQLETLDVLLNVDPGLAKYERENPDEVRDMETAIAREFIRTWKVTKALYDQYGGRVIFQQAGPEPIDAYRDFLKERERKGAFKIHTKSCEALLWEYYTNDQSHVFVATNSVEGSALFNRPWWLADQPKR